jgi:drug/metabolite transporter (DMT)-like permease
MLFATPGVLVPPSRAMRKVWLLGLFAGPLNQGLFFFGLSKSTPAHAALLYALTPLGVYLYSLLRGRERLSLRTFVGIAIAFLGVGILLLGRGLRAAMGPLVGDLLILGAVIAWVIYTAEGKALTAEHGPVRATAWTMIASALLILPIAPVAIHRSGLLAISGVAVGSILYLAFLTSVVAYLLWYFALSRMEASKVAVFANLQPVVTAIGAWALQGEKLTWEIGVGGVLVLLGVRATQVPRFRRTPPLLALLLLAGIGCAPKRTEMPPPPEAFLELVESSPVETALDHSDIPDAKDIWPKMIAQARTSLDWAEFYASNAPGSRLEPVIAAIEAAADRGVRVRFLAEEKFRKTYPHTLARLASRRNIEVRPYDVASIIGGVLHAKYFVVDRRQAFLGSQNFDWRSLEHIQELGVRFQLPHAVGALLDVFETDWLLAGGADRSTRVRAVPGAVFPEILHQGESGFRITPVFSPRGWLPDETLWDLPRLVELIDSAKRTVRVQLLTYQSTDREGLAFDALEVALRRAAARGARVELLLSDWTKRDKMWQGLWRLHSPPAIEIRVETIPPWSGGAIPYARVIHAKYMVVDGQRSWIGTSNWERDYFFKSRNVGMIVESSALGERLDRFFGDGWNAPYSRVLEPPP